MMRLSTWLAARSHVLKIASRRAVIVPQIHFAGEAAEETIIGDAITSYALPQFYPYAMSSLRDARLARAINAFRASKIAGKEWLDAERDRIASEQALP